MLVYSPTFIISNTIAPRKVGNGFLFNSPTIISIRKIRIARRMRSKSVEPLGSGITVPVTVVTLLLVKVVVVVTVGE